MRKVLAALTVAALLGAACGDDDTSSTDDPDETTSPESESGEEPDDGGDGEIAKLTATDYSFAGVPESVPAGTRLTLTNDSGGEVHELVAIRIPENENRSVADLVQLPEDELDAVFPETSPRRR